MTPYNVLGRAYLAQVALAADYPDTTRQYYLTVLEHHPDTAYAAELESLLTEGAGEFPERVEAENLLASLRG